MLTQTLLAELSIDEVLAHRGNGRSELTARAAGLLATADVVVMHYSGGQPVIKGWPLMRNFLKGDERLNGLQVVTIKAHQATPLEIYRLCQLVGVADQPQPRTGATDDGPADQH